MTDLTNSQGRELLLDGAIRLMTVHAVRGVESVHEVRGTEAATTTCEVWWLVRHGCVIGHNVRESTVRSK